MDLLFRVPKKTRNRRERSSQRSKLLKGDQSRNPNSATSGSGVSAGARDAPTPIQRKDVEVASSQDKTGLVRRFMILQKLVLFLCRDGSTTVRLSLIEKTTISLFGGPFISRDEIFELASVAPALIKIAPYTELPLNLSTDFCEDEQLCLTLASPPIMPHAGKSIRRTKRW